MKIWDKGIFLKKEIESFTVGNDYLLDKELIKYDCLASIAHAKMLKSIKVISSKELEELIKNLNKIIDLDSKNNFFIKKEEEDCHTAIENYLVEKLGDTGKKIHTARSRNDQVLAALRLYEKNELSEIKKLIKKFVYELDETINKYNSIEFPGYTHMQKAMPTKIGIWLGSFKEAMQDNIMLLNSSIKLIDKNPLGSAAGFGVPVFKINKEITTKELNFSKTKKNPLYCQLSRGKFEAQIISTLSMIMFDLNKLANDIIIFNTKEFNFIKLSPEICTGSSIMPQKNNPDVLEIIRAKYHVVLGEEIKVKSLIGNLMSGYNRDVQLTKEPLIKCFQILKESLFAMTIALKNMKINKKKCKEALTKEIYSTKKAYELVKKGFSFREAYKIMAEKS